MVPRLSAILRLRFTRRYSFKVKVMSTLLGEVTLPFLKFSSFSMESNPLRRLFVLVRAIFFLKSCPTFRYANTWISRKVVSRRSIQSDHILCIAFRLYKPLHTGIYSRHSLSRNRRDPLKHFEISILRHIRFVVLRKKQFEQPNFTNDYEI